MSDGGARTSPQGDRGEPGESPVVPRRDAFARTRLSWPGGTPADAALAAGTALVAVGGTVAEVAGATHAHPAAAGAYVLAVAAALPLLVRRRRPAMAVVGVSAVVLGYHVLDYPGLAPAVALFIAIYSAAAYARGRWGWLWGLAGIGAMWVIPALPPHATEWTSYALTGPAIGAAAVLVTGAAARGRRLDAERRVREAAATARAEFGQRLAEDRLIIARELHDVLAHSIAVIAVQSGAALDALGTAGDGDAGTRLTAAPGPDLETARTGMRAVRDVATRAMSDLRGALALLRGAEGAPLQAQPRLDDLDELVSSVSSASLTVSLDRGSVRSAVGPLTELAAYRIVQEALTNVVRHAGARTARVSLRTDDGDLLVVVVDDGRGISAASSAGVAGGLGVTGMAERAALVGGTVRVGLGPSGVGTMVTARLPVGGP